jgi:hypothetical protein
MAKLTPETAAAGVAKMALMAFFPGDPDIRAALVSVFMDLVETDEQLDWLVNRALRLYGKWPGVAEIRGLYCSRWKPKDGMETYSSIYPEGIPSERKGARQERDAPRGEPVTADADFDRKVQEAAAGKKMQPAPGRPDVQET